MKIGLASTLRVASYLLIAIIYLSHMNNASSLGIEPLEYQIDRTLNALTNIFQNPGLASIGISSWSEPSANTSQNYFVQIITYLHYIPSYLFGGEESLRRYMRFSDPAVVLAGSILSAELFIRLTGKDRDEISKFICGVVCFTLGATSIYSYRMILSTWHDVYCFDLVVLAALFFTSSKKIAGIASLTLGFMCQYHWGIIFLLYILAANMSILLSPSSRSIYLPPGIRSSRDKLLLALSPTISILVVAFQKFRLDQLGLASSNSNLSYRIGIDSVQNIHHGGIVGSLQFLGGIRANLCLNADFMNGFSQASGSSSEIPYSSIFKFNCLLALSGSVILGVIATVGFIIMSSKMKEVRWFTLPTLFAVAITYSILQQSTSAHLQGRSFLFTAVFSYGLTYLLLLYKKRTTWGAASFWRASFSLIATAAIVINSMKLSLLLGVNG